jgi:hypothetical protein
VGAGDVETNLGLHDRKDASREDAKKDREEVGICPTRSVLSPLRVSALAVIAARSVQILNIPLSSNDVLTPSNDVLTPRMMFFALD